MRAERAWAVAAAVALGGCSLERTPGAVPGRTEFWFVVESGVEFGACSDEPSFRQQVAPRAAEVGDVFIYRVSDDGQAAHQQVCNSLLASDCRESDPPLVFTVSGAELQRASEDKQALGTGGCNLVIAQNWSGWDQGQRMTLEISNVLSLVDAPAACDRVDATYRQQSPNGLGLQGCAFSWKLQLSQDPPAPGGG